MSPETINANYVLFQERQEFMPDHCDRLPQTETTYSPGLEQERWLRGTTHFKTPISKVRHSERLFLTSKPIEVVISSGERYYFAENENLAIYVTGETTEQAVEEFCEQLMHFYYYYKNLTYNQVTGKAQQLKMLYEDLFIEVTE